MRIRACIFSISALFLMTTIAVPIRSGIGIHGIGGETEGQPTITAHAYVQDGLVAMWDGIENAGWGIHDANATIWKDLIGPLDFRSLVSDATWGENCLSVPYKSRQKVAYTSGSIGITTIEIVGKFIEGSRVIFFENGATPSYAIIISSANTMIQGTNGETSYFAWGNKGKAGAISIIYNSDKSMAEAYVDAQSSPFLTSGSTSWTKHGSRSFSLGGRFSLNNYFGGEFYSIRIYSRQLSSAEISFNNEIDKTRFNLE